jgi:hypothetical protein
MTRSEEKNELYTLARQCIDNIMDDSYKFGTDHAEILNYQHIIDKATERFRSQVTDHVYGMINEIVYILLSSRVEVIKFGKDE